ncbi:hypothetical protein G6F56_011230 [Rhizopus delemar]|nr:hypothetical protein G6F56_011230 [Rhizopus delemar]
MGKHLSHLNMNDSWGVSLLDIFGEALGHCPDLKKLSIMNLHSVVEEDMDEVIAAREVHATQIQELSMSLENLSDHSLIRLLGYFPQLGRLELQTQTVRLDSFYQELTKHCPHLESLALNIHHGQALVQPTEKSSLRHFSVRATTLVSARHLALFMTSDRLETLILANCSAIGPTLTSVALVPGALTQLRTLYLTSTLDLNQEDLASILATCTQLRDLKITGSQGVTDDLIEHLPTKIKRIDFSLSMRLTGSGLRQLIKRQTSLEKLVVNNCMNIDYTSVAWAVEQVGKRVIECRQTIKRR